MEMLLSVYNTALLPNSNPAAAPPPQKGVKQEPFSPQGGPGVQIRHDRLVVVPQQEQQQPKQEAPLPTDPAAGLTSPQAQKLQQLQQGVGNLSTSSPAVAAQQQQQQHTPAVKAEGVVSNGT